MPFDVTCAHVAGKEELLDLLHDGVADITSQRKLWSLLNPNQVDIKHVFRVEDLLDYSCEDHGDGIATETWSCPVCDHTHRYDIDTTEIP